MADKTPRPTREKIVLEHLTGGVTYSHLEAKYGIDHAHIHRWVMAHQGKQRDRSNECTPKESTIKWFTPEPEPLPPDPEKTNLTEQLQQARLKITLLEEVIRIAQAEHGLVLPKKSTTAPAARQAIQTVGQNRQLSVAQLCPLLGVSRPHRRTGVLLCLFPPTDPAGPTAGPGPGGGHSSAGVAAPAGDS